MSARRRQQEDDNKKMTTRRSKEQRQYSGIWLFSYLINNIPFQPQVQYDISSVIQCLWYPNISVIFVHRCQNKETFLSNFLIRVPKQINKNKKHKKTKWPAPLSRSPSCRSSTACKSIWLRESLSHFYFFSGPDVLDFFYMLETEANYAQTWAKLSEAKLWLPGSARRPPQGLAGVAS